MKLVQRLMCVAVSVAIPNAARSGVALFLLAVIVGCAAAERPQAAGQDDGVATARSPAAGQDDDMAGSISRQQRSAGEDHAPCETPDDVIDLSNLSRPISTTILHAASVPTGGMEDPDFVRYWLTCAELTQVARLDFGEVSTLTRLPPLPALGHLEVIDVHDGDLEPLRSLTSLRVLSIGPREHAFVKDRQARLKSFAPIGALPNLEELRIANNGLEDISFVSNLLSVRVVEFPENRIRDLSPLAGLESLEQLRLSDNRIHDLAPLGRASHLRLFDISNNPIPSLKPLASAPALEEINATSTGIRDLRWLGTMPRLRSVWLCGAPVTEVPSLNKAARAEHQRLSTAGVRVMINPVSCHCC